MNPFIYSSDNKRYHTLAYYNKRKYSAKIYKAVIDAGLSCPNIDGSKGEGGCIYCLDGSGYFTNEPIISVKQQLKMQIDLIKEKHPNAKITAYFQAFSNTYSDLEMLRKIYEPIIKSKDIVGISIATRADCIDTEIADYLSSICKRTELTVEIGLQTIHDKTAALINRCHTFDEFTVTYDLLANRGIRTCVHIINGLPEENTDMMLKTAQVLGKMKPDAIKIHLLHILAGTKLAQIYENGYYIPMSMEEYAEIVVHQLEFFPAETVIERITGDGPKDKLLAPKWSENKKAVIAAIDKLQVRLNTWQGMNY